MTDRHERIPQSLVLMSYSPLVQSCISPAQLQSCSPGQAGPSAGCDPVSVPLWVGGSELAASLLSTYNMCCHLQEKLLEDPGILESFDDASYTLSGGLGRAGPPQVDETPSMS